jgi:hypothetical protein
MISLGVILYIAVRTLPRIEESAPTEKKSVMERWIASEVPGKLDAALNGFLVKFLRKLKVFLLKVDNSLSLRLRKINPETDPLEKTKPNIDFSEISGKNKEDGNSDSNSIVG